MAKTKGVYMNGDTIHNINKLSVIESIAHRKSKGKIGRTVSTPTSGA